MGVNIGTEIFEGLVGLGFDPERPPEYRKSKSTGCMDLSMDLLDRGVDAEGRRYARMALAHYFEQCGDLVPDPDMELVIYPELRRAEARTYQDQRRFDSVEQVTALARTRLQASLNSFLATWLRNLAQQGHRLDGSTSPQ